MLRLLDASPQAQASQGKFTRSKGNALLHKAWKRAKAALRLGIKKNRLQCWKDLIGEVEKDPGKRKGDCWRAWCIRSCFMQPQSGLMPCKTMLSRGSCSQRGESFQHIDWQEIARAKETIRKNGRHRLVEKWQMRRHGERTGR